MFLILPTSAYYYKLLGRTYIFFIEFVKEIYTEIRCTFYINVIFIALGWRKWLELKYTEMRVEEKKVYKVANFVGLQEDGTWVLGNGVRLLCGNDPCTNYMVTRSLYTKFWSWEYSDLINLACLNHCLVKLWSFVCTDGACLGVF